MLGEIKEIPAVVERQIREGAEAYRDEGLRLRRESPRFLVSCARGSSDQAVTYFKYLVETGVGIPVASVGPSIASVYNATLDFAGGVCLTVSQSGGSPDLVSLQKRAGDGGARTVALLNVTDSPVGNGAGSVLPMLAGPEKAVAATKSFVASLVALASVAANWTEDRALIDALVSLPESLAEALECDWSAAALPIAASQSLFTIGRGPSLGIAGEAALKFKETCRLHAEAYSAAEVRHGPIALARDRFAALVFVNGDDADTSIRGAVQNLEAAGAKAFVAGAQMDGGKSLPTVAVRHALLNPICRVVSFYRFVEALAVSLGENPDAPALLRKVTKTV
ncbi:glutamine-fructose-6-phosphate transaminase (plasmid) [Sinorhizobium fredii NGR234]|uniref:Glutamine-fructose-6-phosphate transaminase n=2 Tax=Rhizobium fredii TaxID=380 RepID=C3KN15_SINFN|nr:glutamine-fructose-6-phosphate transaminase [Sinorhizobium fredii NGR234]